MRKHERHSHEMDLSRDYLQELGYEPRDVSLPVLMRWLVILFVFFGLTALGTWGMYYIFVAEEPNQNARSLDTNMRKIPPPPNPLLQGYPIDDLRDFRKKETEHLDGYFWKDRAKGLATMPVDQALDAVAEKGLPTKGLTIIDKDEPNFSTGNQPAHENAAPSTTDRIPAPMDGHITDGVGRHGPGNSTSAPR